MFLNLMLEQTTERKEWYGIPVWKKMEEDKHSGHR